MWDGGICRRTTIEGAGATGLHWGGGTRGKKEQGSREEPQNVKQGLGESKEKQNDQKNYPVHNNILRQRAGVGRISTRDGTIENRLEGKNH